MPELHSEYGTVILVFIEATSIFREVRRPQQ